MEVILLVLFWLLVALAPLIWLVAFAVFATAKRRFSLRSLFIGVTVECALLGLVVGVFVQRDYEIHFILPQDFRGGFAIVEDTNGVTLKPEHGVYLVNVPSSRLVKVRSFEPFQYWHSESWETKDENEVPVVGDARNGTPSDEVAVRGLGSESRGNNSTRIKYFFGTDAEAKADFDAFAIPID